MSENGSPLIQSLISIGLVLAFVGSAGLILSTGFGETVTVVTDPSNATADSNATFGGTISVPDRIVMIGAVLTLIGPAGLGLVSATSGGPAVGRLIRLAPLALGFIGVIEFSDIVIEMVQGDYVWGVGSQAADMLAVFVTGATVTGLAAAFGYKTRMR